MSGVPAATARWALRLALLALAGLTGAASCDEAEPPSDDTFDGNVVVGDGAPRDLGHPDAEAGVGDGDVPDRALIDVGFSDAEPTDRDPMIGRDGGDPCAAPATQTLSATAAFAAVDRLAGAVIEVTGTATVGPLICTRRGCSMAMPCCNTCQGPVLIDGVLEVLGNACFRNPGCNGDECRVACLPQTLGISQHFRGQLQRGPNNQPGIALFGVR